MKYIIIGLGNFGGSLGSKLTSMGHEVIGVDKDMHKIEMYKDRITHSVCLEASSLPALSTLPIDEANEIIVAIGEDLGESIMITALLKQLKVKYITSRAITQIHRTVLEAIGVHNIILPEQDAAEQYAVRMTLPGTFNSLALTDDYSVYEIIAPEQFVGASLAEIDLQKNFDVQLIAVKKVFRKLTVMGSNTEDSKLIDISNQEYVVEKKDHLVILGHHHSIEKLLRIP